jgi:hypothetical protein
LIPKIGALVQAISGRIVCTTQLTGILDLQALFGVKRLGRGCVILQCLGKLSTGAPAVGPHKLDLVSLTRVDHNEAGRLYQGDSLS